MVYRRLPEAVLPSYAYRVTLVVTLDRPVLPPVGFREGPDASFSGYVWGAGDLAQHALEGGFP